MTKISGDSVQTVLAIAGNQSDVVNNAGANGEKITAEGTGTALSGSNAPTGSTASGSGNTVFGLPMTDYLYQSGIQPLPENLYENQALKAGLGEVGLAPKDSAVVNDNADGGASILINSDRVIINSKSNHTIIAGARGVALTSPQKVNIDADESVTVFGAQGVYLGVPNKGKQPTAYPPKDLLSNPAFVKGGKKLKSYPSEDTPYEPIVLGYKLINWLDDLLVVIKNMQILTPVGLATAREDAQWDFIAMQSRLKELVSDYIFIDGYSHEVPDFKSVPEPPKEVTKPKTSIDVNVTVTGLGATPPSPGAVSSPNMNKPGYYEGSDKPTPTLIK